MGPILGHRAGMNHRVVIVDPGYSGPTGHHAELNRQLIAACRAQGWSVECWADQSLLHADPSAMEQASRPIFQNCGYLDPRHWLDLAGCLHLAARLCQQIEAALQAAPPAQPPVTLWIAHSLLPFQLIGLAQALQHQPPARLEVGILYAPGERLGGSTEPSAATPGPARERELAIANARFAWCGLAQACRRAGHQVRLGCASEAQARAHQPLLAAAGLPAAQLQPAVVGAGLQPASIPAAEAAPQVLLHWGDLKPSKGRQITMGLLDLLLHSPELLEGLPPLRWLFHHFGQEPLAPQERDLLQRAQARLSGFRLWQGRVDSEAMQAALADTAVALLPYDPIAYAERSSGVLWCYGAARLAVGRSAIVVGCNGGWLEQEAIALGLEWLGIPSGDPPSNSWWALMAQALQRPCQAPALTDYGRQVLGSSYAHWVLSG